MINDELYFKELQEIEKRYLEIIGELNLNFPRPLNLVAQKNKFFRAIADDKMYNPQFKYEKKIYNIDAIKNLKNFKISTKNDLYGFKKLYKDKIRSKLNDIKSHQNWGKPISTKYVIKSKGYPSLILLSKAKNYCKNYKREIVKFKVLTPEKVSKRLQQEIFRLTKNQINVVFVNIPSKVSIFPYGNTLKINPHEKLTSLDVKRLKIHEIGVHYMRYYNAQKFNINILSTGTSNYLKTEEGLAVYAEEQKGLLSKAQMFIYAGRVIATYYAPQKSFYEIYSILRHYGFKETDAFAITFRSKRNISDTSQKGGFTKDYVYFDGYFKVKKYLKKHDIKTLFIGKIKIEDVKTIKKFIQKNYDKIETIFD
ncbi:MAG: tyrosine/phenylalanine carboxypeptidase domain-containing protein [Nanoarchaeota archaeon]